MATHSYQLAGTKLFAAGTLLSIISGKPLKETLQMVSYDADNPEASVNVAVPDGSRWDTLDFDAAAAGEPRVIDFNMIEGRIKENNNAGLRFENFENFSVSTTNKYDGTTFKLQGTEGANRFNITSGDSEIYAGGENDVMTVQAGGTHRLHGGSGNKDVANLEGGRFTLVDVDIDNGGGADAGRWLVFSDGNKETRVHESTELININGTQSFDAHWDSHRVEINDRRPNARREHDLEGTFRNEDFHGGRGRDNLTGSGGADHFYLEDNHRRAFGSANADRITDFSIAENDMVQIDGEAFGVEAGTRVRVARNSRHAERLLDRGRNEFIYDGETGSLYFDRNGREEGSGNGLIAIVQGDDAGNLTHHQFEVFA